MKHFRMPERKMSLMPPTQLARKDFISAQLVEIGIVIQYLEGTKQAASYLCSRKVNLEVARRVLSQPSQRRLWSTLE